MSDADLWAIARKVCTPAELRALRKREDLHRRGMFTWLGLAYALGCSVRTARDRIDRAEARIKREEARR